MAKNRQRNTAQSHPQPETQLPELFRRLNVRMERDGSLRTSPETPALLQLERLRQSREYRTVDRIPSAPRYLYADAVGQGVTRNAWNEPLTDRHLRQYGRKAPVAVKARSACVSQVSSAFTVLTGKRKAMDGQVGVRVVHKDHFRSEEVPEGFDKFISRAEEMLETPFDGDAYAPPVLSLHQLVQGLYGDIFDLNRGVLEPIRRNGEIVGVRPADAGLIIPAWDTVRLWTMRQGTTVTAAGHDLRNLTPRQRLEAVSQDLVDRRATDEYVDLTRAEWVVYRDGIVDGYFAPGEIIVLPMLTSTDTEYAGHPPSYVQLGMEFAATSWVINDYHGRKFTDAAWNSMILAVIGEGYDDEGFSEFLGNYRTSVKGYQRAGRPTVVKLPDGGDLKTIDTRPPVTDAEFKALEEKVEAGFCAIIRRHPEIINGSVHSASGPSLSGPSEEVRIRVSREEGQRTDVMHVCAYLTRYVRMGVHDDLRVIPEFPSGDRKALAEVANLEVQHTRTANEVRVERGDTPIGFFLTADELKVAPPEQQKEWKANPWNYPADPGFVTIAGYAAGFDKSAPPSTGAAENDA